MGTAPIAVPTLKALTCLDGVDVVGVLSQPPKRRGRGRKEKPSAVHACALELGLPVATPTRLAGAEGDTLLDRFAPDACLVMAYGQIITQAHLDRCPNGWLNLHASLLPRWRGAAPIERCLEAGDAQTGVQIMHMERGLDTGPVYAEAQLETTGHDAGTLSEALGHLAAKLTQNHVLATLRGERIAKKQDDAQSCYAHRIERHEGHIDFSGHASVWARRARAFNPRLGLRCQLNRDGSSQSLKIWHASEVAEAPQGKPGQIMRCDRHELWVACEESTLRIESLQLDGKKRLLWQQFYSGNPCSDQDCFET
jgi:methionyl-tRNA formyltransferase